MENCVVDRWDISDQQEERQNLRQDQLHWILNTRFSWHWLLDHVYWGIRVSQLFLQDFVSCNILKKIVTSVSVFPKTREIWGVVIWHISWVSLWWYTVGERCGQESFINKELFHFEFIRLLVFYLYSHADTHVREVFQVVLAWYIIKQFLLCLVIRWRVGWYNKPSCCIPLHLLESFEVIVNFQRVNIWIILVINDSDDWWTSFRDGPTCLPDTLRWEKILWPVPIVGNIIIRGIVPTKVVVRVSC